MTLEDRGYTLTEYAIDQLGDHDLEAFLALSNELSRENQPRHVDITREE